MVHVFGKVFGKGVQDLAYGTTEPAFRVFEIAVSRQFLPYHRYVEAAISLSVQTVPLLYRGPFKRSILKGHRDCRTTFGGAHVREGTVIRATDGGRTGQCRKICKMISPDYLLRKNTNATEFN